MMLMPLAEVDTCRRHVFCASYISTVMDRPGPRNIMSEGLAHRHALGTHSTSDGPSWLAFALQHNECANPEGIAFVRSLRGVHPFWRDTCDDIMGNCHWMAPSVTGGFAFVEHELPELIRDALNAMLDRNRIPTYEHREKTIQVFPVFQQKVALIVEAMHLYSSDLPTQSRIIHALVQLFRNPAIVLHVRGIMEDIPYTMPLVRAVLKNMKLYRREYDVGMLCIQLLRLLCRNPSLSRRIGIDCGAVNVLLAIMNTDDVNFDNQPASYAPLRIACYDVLMGLCAEQPETRQHVYAHGGVAIVRQVMMRDMGLTGPTVSVLCNELRR